MDKKYYCFVCNKKAFYFCGNGCKTTYCGESCATKVYTSHKAICSLLIEGRDTKKRDRTFATVIFHKGFSGGDIIYGTDENELCIPEEYGIIQEQIGEGLFGTVFSMSDESVVLKAVPLNTPILDDHDCNPFDKWDRTKNCIIVSEIQFLQEAESAKIAGNLGVGPEVMYTTICKGWLKLDAISDEDEEPESRSESDEDEFQKYQPDILIGIIIMKKAGVSLKDYKEKYPRRYKAYAESGDHGYDRFYKEAEKLSENLPGGKHPDLHDGNIMIEIDSEGNYKPGTMKLIDFFK